jgi:hypothetical protein
VVVTNPAALPVDAGGAAFFCPKSSFLRDSFRFAAIPTTKNPAFLSEAGFTEYLDVTVYLLPGPPISSLT